MKSKLYLLLFLTTLVPVIPMQVQAQQDDSPITPPSLQVSNGGLHDLPLKAIQDSDGDIDTQEDFEIQPGDIITVGQSSDFHVLPNNGAVEAVKITDDALQTTDLVFSASTGRVSQTLAPKAYLLDVIVLMENDDRYLYETVMAVLAPGQTLQQVNVQNIIQNFVTTRSDTHTTVIFEDEGDDDEPPGQDREEICRFTPSHPICAPNEDGECGEGFAMNEDGQCFPRGDCPDGYHRANDDETGACISEDALEQCPDGSWQHPADTCFGEVPTPTPEPEQPLDSNCGGVPCTASEKEDSTTSDPVPGEPHTPTESEETVAEIEEQEEEESADEESNGNDNEEDNNDSDEEEN